MDTNVIHNEDCLTGMQRIPDAPIDAIIADLPYGVLNRNNKNAGWDNIIPLAPMWEQYLRIIKPNGAIILFGQGLFSAQLMLSQPALYRYSLVWRKDRVTGHLNAKRMPLRQHEDIFVFYKAQPTYNPQMVPCSPEQRNHGRKTSTGTNRCYGSHKVVL